MGSVREEVLDALAAKLTGLSLGRPLRVAVDGRTASGKTTLADEIAGCIGRKGRPVIRTSIDGFHRPRAERYARGRYSAEGYYHDARDLPAIDRLLLDPLGPGGDRRYRTESLDLESDQPIEQKPQLAPDDAILVVDGTFLQRPELRGSWDAVIFVAVSAAVSESRGIARDTELFGGEEAARHLYAQRYGPACDIYERSCVPATIADIIWDNSDFERPHLQIRPGGRLDSAR